LLLGALLVAGCGSSSSSSSSSSASAPASSSASATTTQSSAPGGGAAVTTKKDKLGTIVAAGPKKLTVYMFEGDKGTKSSCAGKCAKAWPPVTTTGKPTVGGKAVAADLSTTTRADGQMQVTYKGHPLYYFSKDKDSGDAYGQGAKAFGANWYVLMPNGNKIDKS
jgi:predicted lipoprotein with Yx(FWY)xxD motif